MKCGFDDRRALDIDHVYGDGARDREVGPANWYWTLVLRSVKRGEGRYQVLCCNCNRIKGIEEGLFRMGRQTIEPDPQQNLFG